jgi:hypothetical protein
VQAPTHPAHDDTGSGSAYASHQRRDPAAIEGEAKQVSRRQNQGDDTNREKDALANVLF